MNTWVVYPGTFGDLNGLRAILPRLKELGVNQVHLLPFYETSGDDGFEVVNNSLAKPLRVAQQWGGLSAFKRLARAAANNGITIMADAVLNHISGRSPVIGEIGLENLCLSWKKTRLPFKFLRLETDPAGGVDAVYDFNGREVKQIVIFPEQADAANPHLTKVGSKYVWHTFYPNQFDLDLNRPAGLRLALNSLRQIAAWLGGQGTIRLDAIPFVGKRIDGQRFEFIDSPQGLKLVAKLRSALNGQTPGIDLLAEAARPLESLAKYIKIVGGAYDFLSFPRFAAGLALADMSWLVDQVNLMVKELGLKELSRLTFALQTHDDIPLAELGDARLSRSVWKILKQRGAVPFGIKKRGDIPKGAVIRLMDVCGQNPERLAAAFALAALMPHGRLLWLYGTEVGQRTGRVLPPEPGCQPEARTAIRQPLDPSGYLKMLSAPLAQKIGKILKMRLEVLPDQYDFWQAKAAGSRVTVKFSGTKNGQKIAGSAKVNFAGPFAYELDILKSLCA